MANVSMPNLDEVKPNSHQYRKDNPENEEARPEEEKKVEKVVTGKVTRKKKSFGRKLVDIFFKDGEDIGDIKVYLIEEVLVPTIKETIADSISGAIGMLFFGEARRRSSKVQNGSKVHYGSYFNGGNQQSRKERISQSSRDRAEREAIDDFYFESRSEAEQVRDEMLELLDSYGQVTVADYLDMLGISSEFTDHKFGWTDLGPLKVVATRGGYRLDLPREVALSR